MGILVIYGWDKDMLYVNSCTGIAREKLFELGVPVNLRGALTRAQVLQEFGTVAVAVGIAARKIIEEEGHYSKRGANKVIADMIVPESAFDGVVEYYPIPRIKSALNQRRANTSVNRKIASDKAVEAKRRKKLAKEGK